MQKSIAEMYCRKVLQKSIAEMYCRKVLQKSIAEMYCRKVIESKKLLVRKKSEGGGSPL
ncbi:hypothetical protein [Methanosarcina sp. WWM596]|uniref:hypothetical protein n=1 Tax=Methanosarcina sp. WWM596 TaxID=1434103 RepID=UPI000B1C46E5|nr:hypothetical protein [Methanosarcina sp. WWM596]